MKKSLIVGLIIFTVLIISGFNVLASVKLTSPELVVEAQEESQLDLKWKKVDGAEGYIIYKSNPTDRDYIKLEEINDPSILSYTDKDVQSGEKYSYKIVSYNVENNKKILSDESKIVSAQVPEEISSIELSEKEVSIKTGESFDVKAEESSGKEVTDKIDWSSNDKEVATVEEGKIIGESAGKTTITATTPNGETESVTLSVGITETNGEEEFSDAVSEQVQESKPENPEKEKTQTESPYALKRIIAETTGAELDVKGLNAESVVVKDNIYVIQFKTEADTQKALETLKTKEGILYAEPDSTLKTEATKTAAATDSFKSWGATKIGAGTYAKKVQSSTSNSIKVAVIDTGVSNHPFLEGRIASGGKDYVNSDSDTTDDNGHGTHIAGTIVDCTPGLKVNILPLKVMDAKGEGSMVVIGNAIRYATDQGAKVINLSAGGVPGAPHNTYLENSILYAISKGAIFVTVSGNEGVNTSTICPAHMDQVIIVGAVDQNNKRPSFSNYGTSVDLVAPGVAIKSCSNNGGYTYMSGTSMAVPHISALVAMLKLMHPNYNENQISQLLTSSCKDLGSLGRDNFYGYGLPNLENLDEGGQKTVNPTGINLSNTSLAINVGQSKTLTATVLPSDATDKTVTWKSSNNNIALVNSSGVVRGIAAGSATITATTVNGKSKTCKVTVSQAKINPSGLSISKTSLTLEAGKTYRLTATITPSNATDKSVVWSSSNTAVATVDSSGLVKAKSKGAATVTARTSNGITKKCSVTVQAASTAPKNVLATGVNLNKTAASIGVGKTVKLIATVIPSNTTNKKVTWSSSKSTVATVDSNGLVKGISKGKAEIVVRTSNGKTKKCVITVGSSSSGGNNTNTINPTDITLNTKTATISAGKTVKLTATVIPENATNKTVTWKSSKPAIATVKNTGLVTGVSQGTAVITAQTSNGKTKSCTVTVLKRGAVRVTDVALDSTSISLSVGKSQKLTATISPSNATNKKLRWNSEDNTVATVNSVGTVTAKGVGTTTITVVTDDKGKTKSCQVTVTKGTPGARVSGVNLNKSSVNLKVGGTTTLAATVLPENADNKKINWNSSNPLVATVDSNGKITGKKKGSAIITVTTADQNKKDICLVVVSETGRFSFGYATLSDFYRNR